MSPAEPQVLIARAAVARVLGIEESALRADSPLALLGWDSLGCVCWSDAVAADGWRSESRVAVRAVTIFDLAGSLAPAGSSA